MLQIEEYIAGQKETNTPPKMAKRTSELKATNKTQWDEKKKEKRKTIQENPFAKNEK